jgi:hypothetical protein
LHGSGQAVAQFGSNLARPWYLQAGGREFGAKPGVSHSGGHAIAVAPLRYCGGFEVPIVRSEALIGISNPKTAIELYVC